MLVRAGQFTADERSAAPTLSHAATHDLRELIIQGELRAGEHVQEQRVCDRLGMSRTPVRAALANLATEGYLIYRPNRGYFVRQFELPDIKELWDIRSVLEGLAARHCAEHGISPEEETILSCCVLQGDQILENGPLDKIRVEPYRQMNITFHETILRACKIRALPGVVKAAQNLPLASERIMIWQDFQHLKRSHDDHRRVLEAILAGEGARAEALMREHIYYAGTFVTSHIAHHGVPSRADDHVLLQQGALPDRAG